MMKTLVRIWSGMAALCLLLSGVAASAQSAASPPDPAANPCQRTCLEGWVDKYLAAMQAHAVDPALFARDIKFTENGVRLPLGGEGLWRATSGLGGYKFYVPDVDTQQVAFIGTVKERSRKSGETEAKDRLVAIALRLRIQGGKITEVEQLAIRPDGTEGTGTPPRRSTGERVEAMVQPHAVFRAAIPPAERASREDLISAADYYFAGLQRNDGKGYYPFTDDCVRYENGNDAMSYLPDPATGKPGYMSCKRQFEVGLKNVVSRIRDRRFVAVDRERGIVFAFGFFDHHDLNWTWQLGELFKIDKGQIRRIEAVFDRAPFGTNSGWSTYEQGLSEEIQSVR